MNSKQSSPVQAYWLWPTIMIGGVFLLALLPGGFAEKSRLLLHGLCAQTPGHTFSLGDQPLPFDARMTGIYTGVAGTLAVFAFRRKLLAQVLPSRGKLAVLALFVIAMAADGFNSLLTDLVLWHPWTTTNYTRIVTGYAAGVALAVAMVWLLGGTVFQVSDRGPILETWPELLLCLAFLPIVAVILWLAPAVLYIPFSILLVGSAWIVLATLATVTVLLATKYDERIVRRPQLHVPGAFGLIIGLGVMLMLAFGRQWLESTLGIPSTF